VRFEYQHVASEIIVAGHDKHVYGDRVNAGRILTVNCCYFYVPDIKTAHIVSVFIENGSQPYMVRSRGKETGRRGMTIMCPFFVGEYQRVVGYAPNADIGNEISLNIMGYLTPLWEWRGLK